METKKQKLDISLACGRFLVDFVNAENQSDAAKDLIAAAKKELNFSPKPFRLLEHLIPNDNDQKQMLVNLMNDLISGVSLHENKWFIHYLMHYKLVCIRSIDIDDKDNYYYTDHLGDSDSHDHIIAYCVVTFLEVKRHRKLIGKCIECGKYKVFAGGNVHRFCSTRCRNKYHSRIRTQTGQSAAYARARRKQGLDQ